MKKIAVCILTLFSGVSLPAADYSLVKNGHDRGAEQFTLEMTDQTDSAKKRVLIAGGDLLNPKRIAYIFHGYKPSNDPYKQDPSYFVSNWSLTVLAEKYQTVFVLPDNGDSVYPSESTENSTSDLKMLIELEKIIRARYSSARDPIVIGFSGGVEGAIKFTRLTGMREIITISGNYDIFSLPVNEQRFHSRAFGNKKETWEQENPLLYLKQGPTLNLYLFCEERNPVNVKQAAKLMRENIKAIQITDLRNLGKGYSHNWDFLTSPGILHAIETILSGDPEQIMLLTNAVKGNSK